jgi:ABC-type branched-subunit amino acid transport system ATPase component
VVALLGANGAGKTTTLRAISGLLKHGTGAVKLGGTDLADVAPAARARLGIAHVPSGRGLFFGLTVAEHFRLDSQGNPADTDAAFAHRRGAEQRRRAARSELPGWRVVLTAQPPVQHGHRVGGRGAQAG